MAGSDERFVRGNNQLLQWLSLFILYTGYQALVGGAKKTHARARHVVSRDPRTEYRDSR